LGARGEANHFGQPVFEESCQRNPKPLCFLGLECLGGTRLAFSDPGSVLEDILLVGHLGVPRFGPLPCGDEQTSHVLERKTFRERPEDLVNWSKRLANQSPEC
jgi:hypothetical protein